MVYFKDHTRLKTLNLGDTFVTDVGLSNFTNCRDISVLALNGNKGVSDAGLILLFPILSQCNCI
jgi:hypothetical protein